MEIKKAFKRSLNFKYLIMQSKIFSSIILSIIICFPIIANAQPYFTDDTSDAPVDGGLSVLISAGIGYAIKKTRIRKTNKKADSM